MNIPTLLISLLILTAVTWIITAQIRAKKTGKGGCSCHSCANRGACHLKS